MDIRTLRYFEAAATTESFRKAADLMHVGQPTLSKQIIHMEKELGCEVFIRANQRVYLSPAGKVFLEDARRVLREFDIAVRRVKEAASGESGSLRIGCRDTAGRCLSVSRTITHFHEVYPQVELYIEPMMSIAQCDALLNGQIDLAIAYSPPPTYSQFSRLTIVKESAYLALPEYHRLAGVTEVDATDLADEAFIIIRDSKHNFFGHSLMSGLNSLGLSPKVSQVVDDDAVLATLVSLGMGVCIMLSPSQKLTPPGIVFKPIKNYAHSIDLELVWLTSSTSRLVHNFVSTMHTVVGTS